jgi:ABC-type Fe3+/spermidine/putrescine transport system ATPase subunit
MLEVRAIEKSYEGKPLLRGVSFSLEMGDTICLLGASGSGKSTLLRIIAGLEEAEGGDVLWDGKSILDVPVHRRNFGLMFQDYALFPHRSVAQNVAFGLRMHELPQDEIDQRVQSALEQVNMAGFARRNVTDLSGGEQQRVALARAIAPRPRLLMLDEPLGALDRTLREQLTSELRQLLHHTGIPTIYVTHDQEEAFALADRLVLLSEGNVVQTGSPVEVYRQPKNAWVARFLGMGNLLAGKVVSTQPLHVHTELGVFESAPYAELSYSIGAAVELLLRPGGACGQREQNEKNQLTGTVKDVLFAGENYRVTLDCGKGYNFNFTLDSSPRPGEVMQLNLAPESVICLEA